MTFYRLSYVTLLQFRYAVLFRNQRSGLPSHSKNHAYTRTSGLVGVCELSRSLLKVPTARSDCPNFHAFFLPKKKKKNEFHTSFSGVALARDIPTRNLQISYVSTCYWFLFENAITITNLFSVYELLRLVQLGLFHVFFFKMENINCCTYLFESRTSIY